MKEKMKAKSVIGKILAITLVLGLLVATGAVAGETAITGTVDENDSGMIIISADDGDDYLVKGQDLSGMIGNTVKVTGTMAEEDDAKTITVMELEEVED